MLCESDVRNISVFPPLGKSSEKYSTQSVHTKMDDVYFLYEPKPNLTLIDPLYSSQIREQNCMRKNLTLVIRG